MFTKKILERKKILTLLVSLMLLSIFSIKFNSLTNQGNEVDKNKLMISALTPPIYIDDTNPTQKWAVAVVLSWCSGSGSEGDPYLLKNLIIDGLGTSSCIVIENSRAYFIIQNCTLYNGGGIWGAGIILNNVTNGKIIENNCSESKLGIGIQYGSYNEILNNHVSKTTPYYGIDLEDSPNNIISGNEIRRCIGGIDILNSSGNTVSGNLIKDNQNNGINMYISTNNDVLGNTFQNNSAFGIRLSSTNDTIIKNNVLNKNNLSGLYLYEASNNQFINNEISDSTTCGTLLSPNSEGNLFSENFFLRNKKHAYDYGANNDWNSLTIGNYWDNYTGTDANYDGIGDTPHDIPGDASSKDYLPIWDDGVPLINITSPLNNSNIGRDAPDFLVEITEPNLDTMWYTIDGGINNITCTSNGTIDQTSWETLWDSLAKGDTITIMFYANDTYDHLGSNFIILIKYVPEDIIGLDFFATSLLILIASGIAIIAIIAKIHSKKRIISH